MNLAVQNYMKPFLV